MSPAATLAPAPSAAELSTRLAALLRRLEASAPDPGRVRLVAVTKGFEPAAVAAALAVGLRDIGENYATELLGKAALFPPGAGPTPVWHYLGAVQRRRVPGLAPVVGLWHGLARIEEGEAIGRRAPGAAVLVEVELSGAPGRNGCRPEAVPGLVGRLRDVGLDVQGLMTVAPPGPPSVARQAFRACAGLAGELGLRELSMGMSGDVEIAVEEGATMVRVGQALFGPRHPGR